MTRDEFRNAIRKGQGRVIQRLREGSADEFFDLIEHACTHHLSFDAQCEGSREDYMTEIAGYVGGLSRFRTAILKALQVTENYWDTSQLFGLARRLAVGGDQEAREIMYAKFRAAIESQLELPGALDLIELDGKVGLRAVAEAHGRQCMLDPDYWPDDVRWFTNASFGEGAVEAALVEDTADNPALKAYLDRVTRDNTKRRERAEARLTNDELKRMTFEEIISHWVSSGDIDGAFMMFRWGKIAPELEMRKAAQSLASEDNQARLKALLRTFRASPFPLEPDILLKILTTHSDDRTISRLAEVALQTVKAPEVRAAALAEITQSGNMSRGLYLLCANYQPEDANTILSLLPEQDEDAETIHDIGHGLLDVFEEDRIGDATEVFAWMWEHSPCAICRMKAFERLDTLSCVPAMMRDEGTLDFYPALRAMARGDSGASQ